MGYATSFGCEHSSPKPNQPSASATPTRRSAALPSPRRWTPTGGGRSKSSSRLAPRRRQGPRCLACEDLRRSLESDLGTTPSGGTRDLLSAEGTSRLRNPRLLAGPDHRGAPSSGRRTPAPAGVLASVVDRHRPGVGQVGGGLRVTPEPLHEGVTDQKDPEPIHGWEWQPRVAELIGRHRRLRGGWVPGSTRRAPAPASAGRTLRTGPPRRRRTTPGDRQVWSRQW